MSQCLSITINDDVLVEGDQDFTVTLTLIDDDLESPYTSVPVTIVDNDGTVSSNNTLLCGTWNNYINTLLPCTH